MRFYLPKYNKVSIKYPIFSASYASYDPIITSTSSIFDISCSFPHLIGRIFIFVSGFRLRCVFF